MLRVLCKVFHHNVLHSFTTIILCHTYYIGTAPIGTCQQNTYVYMTTHICHLYKGVLELQYMHVTDPAV